MASAPRNKNQNARPAISELGLKSGATRFT
jgi:hypothetical protein